MPSRNDIAIGTKLRVKEDIPWHMSDIPAGTVGVVRNVHFVVEWYFVLSWTFRKRRIQTLLDESDLSRFEIIPKRRRERGVLRQLWLPFTFSD